MGRGKEEGNEGWPSSFLMARCQRLLLLVVVVVGNPLYYY